MLHLLSKNIPPVSMDGLAAEKKKRDLALPARKIKYKLAGKYTTHMGQYSQLNALI
jgi:hypothetical protein